MFWLEQHNAKDVTMAVGTERWPPCPSLIYLPEMASCQHCQCVSILHSSIASSRSVKHEYSTAKASLSRPVLFWLNPDHSPLPISTLCTCASRASCFIPPSVLARCIFSSVRSRSFSLVSLVSTPTLSAGDPFFGFWSCFVPGRRQTATRLRWWWRWRCVS